MDSNIRFIKLGEGGEWEASCIEDGTLRLGYTSPFHLESLNGQWGIVRDHWLKVRGGKERVASNDINQIRSFYEASENDIWITFYQRKMYWCKAYSQVEEHSDDLSRVRKVIGNWSCLDANGKELTIDNLDGRVSKVQGYRGTICTVAMQEYLHRKIIGLPNPEVQRAEHRVDELLHSIEQLIKGLWWYDFELLIDLVFTKSGWHRYSVLGKTEKDIDLDLFSPTTTRRAFAQVKSSTSKTELECYLRKFENYENYDEFFFIYHTSSDDLETLSFAEKHIHVLGGKSLARLVLTTGLVQWLIEKRT
ncbi:leucyl-tRNA synthetase [Shewanella waksmanii]|uniref:leucyl-tRNA synthetase n=1 Tax=Shewanella waksmanii TaxID=213783 RepID=UPI00048FA513|nr:leucyl-tRNA synthetase [Shewanella waksmanii]